MVKHESCFGESNLNFESTRTPDSADQVQVHSPLIPRHKKSLQSSLHCIRIKEPLWAKNDMKIMAFARFDDHGVRDIIPKKYNFFEKIANKYRFC